MTKSGSDYSDRNSPIGCSEVTILFFCFWINDSQWPLVKMQESINSGMNRLYDIIQLIKIGNQNDQRFGMGTAFNSKDPLDSLLVSGIATNTPDSICWIEDDSALLEAKNRLLDDLLDGFPIHCGDNRII